MTSKNKGCASRETRCAAAGWLFCFIFPSILIAHHATHTPDERTLANTVITTQIHYHTHQSSAIGVQITWTWRNYWQMETTFSLLVEICLLRCSLQFFQWCFRSALEVLCHKSHKTKLGWHLDTKVWEVGKERKKEKKRERDWKKKRMRESNSDDRHIRYDSVLYLDALLGSTGEQVQAPQAVINQPLPPRCTEKHQDSVAHQQILICRLRH